MKTDEAEARIQAEIDESKARIQAAIDESILEVRALLDGDISPSLRAVILETIRDVDEMQRQYDSEQGGAHD